MLFFCEHLRALLLQLYGHCMIEWAISWQILQNIFLGQLFLMLPSCLHSMHQLSLLFLLVSFCPYSSFILIISILKVCTILDSFLLLSFEHSSISIFGLLWDDICCYFLHPLLDCRLSLRKTTILPSSFSVMKEWSLWWTVSSWGHWLVPFLILLGVPWAYDYNLWQSCASLALYYECPLWFHFCFVVAWTPLQNLFSIFPKKFWKLSQSLCTNQLASNFALRKFIANWKSTFKNMKQYIVL